MKVIFKKYEDIIDIAREPPGIVSAMISLFDGKTIRDVEICGRSYLYKIDLYWWHINPKWFDKYDGIFENLEYLDNMFNNPL